MLMSNWYLIVFVIIAAAEIILLPRSQNAGATRREVERRAESRPGSAHGEDREDARLANMSAEDRAWETASLQRNKAIQERRGTLTE
jgi:hypothetical protein